MHIVADIGGTKTRIAGSRDLENLSEPIIIDTPSDSYQQGLETLANKARDIAGEEQIETIAIGLPGSLSHDKQTLLKSRHLVVWCNNPVASDLQQLLGGRVYLENDTALVGLGEAVAGAGKGAAILAYITVSTGINGVRVVDGTIDRSVYGFEIGGQYLTIDATPATFEDLTSGTAIEEKYGKHPRDLGKDHLVWEDLARIVAIGVHNTILHWSPERVVLGGSMFKEIGISVERVGEHVREIMKKFREVPPIMHSALGDVGGLYGGLALLKEHS
jgi:predicted NBD/HSP70 family sugar kinase